MYRPPECQSPDRRQLLSYGALGTLALAHPRGDTTPRGDGCGRGQGQGQGQGGQGRSHEGPESYDYLVHLQDGLCRASNGLTRRIEFESADAAVVLQAAIAALVPLGGGRIVLRRGTYTLGSDVAITTTGASAPVEVHIEGAGRNNTVLVRAAATTAAVRISGHTGLRIRIADLRIEGAGPVGLELDAVQGGFCERISVVGAFQTALSNGGLENNSNGFRDSTFVGTDFGVRSASTHSLFEGCICRATGPTGIGFESNDTVSVLFKCDLESAVTGLHFSGTGSVAQSNTVMQCFFDQNQTAIADDGNQNLTMYNWFGTGVVTRIRRTSVGLAEGRSFEGATIASPESFGNIRRPGSQYELAEAAPGGGALQKVVTLPVSEPDANYLVQATAHGNASVWIAGKTPTSFVLHYSVAGGVETEWRLTRPTF